MILKGLKVCNFLKKIDTWIYKHVGIRLIFLKMFLGFIIFTLVFPKQFKKDINSFIAKTLISTIKCTNSLAFPSHSQSSVKCLWSQGFQKNSWKGAIKWKEREILFLWNIFWNVHWRYSDVLTLGTLLFLKKKPYSSSK